MDLSYFAVCPITWDHVFRSLRLTRAALGRLRGPSVRTAEPATYTCVRWPAIVDQSSKDAAQSGLPAAGVQRMGQLKWRLSISAWRKGTLQLCELVRVWWCADASGIPGGRRARDDDGQTGPIPQKTSWSTMSCVMTQVTTIQVLPVYNQMAQVQQVRNYHDRVRDSQGKMK